MSRNSFFLSLIFMIFIILDTDPHSFHMLVDTPGSVVGSCVTSTSSQWNGFSIVFGWYSNILGWKLVQDETWSELRDG